MTESITKSEEAKASSAHSRINMPLNLQNWKTLPDRVQSDLLWFHQHLLDARMTREEAEEAVQYDWSSIFKFLKGTNEGSYHNFCIAIRRYKKIVEQRACIQKNEIVDNEIIDVISSGLDYALANNSITTIIGESRMGKTVSALSWRNRNNHGTSVYVIAPPCGGTKMFLMRIADAVGVNKNNLSIPQMYLSISRSFNRNRILIVDEAHRLIPSDRRGDMAKLEILRDLHDNTKCALALIATQRFTEELHKSHYQFEQILGRIGMPIRLKPNIQQKDIMPIITQYIKNPSKQMITECSAIANNLGRLGILVETLKVGSRIASKVKQTMNEKHFFQAIAMRRQMSEGKPLKEKKS